jgi:hypothetical protein
MSTTTKSKEALELSYVEFRQAKFRVNKALNGGFSAKNRLILKNFKKSSGI